MARERGTAHTAEATVSDIETVLLKFFLNLYRVQLGLPEESGVASSIRRLNIDGGGSERTYELCLQGNRRKCRRMTLAQLGEKSGSKSTCFKVVYDDLLVVKIPPKPITEFDEYIESIDGERRIAQRLSPDVECIAPSVSALLRKVPTFLDELKKKPGDLEAFLIKKLKESPHLQDHLKIGETFAFFMSLSKYSFLGQVIERMHTTESKIQEEIFSQFDLLWNLMAFEGIFGSQNSQIFFSINEIYNEYEERINTLLKDYEGNTSAFMYKRKEWFLLFLSKKEIDTRERHHSPRFFASLDRLFEDIYRERREDVDDYRKMMQAHVRQKVFEQNRSQFKGIIANLLQVIYWLRQKGIAIRDLKPDNIFVVGGHFLQSARDFSLGLIDFETAVDLQPKGGLIAQPLLAGTPSYATPSHLVKNEIIEKSSLDLVRVVHFQDWQAVIGMIFYVVTRVRLFENNRRWLAETWRQMNQVAAGTVVPEEAFVKSSRLFWFHVSREFRGKLKRHEAALKSTEVVLTDFIKSMFHQELKTSRMKIVRAAQKLVKEQIYFRSEKSHRDLLRSSLDIIRRCRRNWEDGVNVPETRPEIRADIITVLRRMEALKFEAEARVRMIRLLEKPEPTLSAYNLLEMMFTITLESMYRREWGDLEMMLGSIPDAEEDTESTLVYEDTITPEETINYERTISYEDTVVHDETMSFEDPSKF